jgi:diguanylate cyclase (GGDEF)-like protein
LRCAFFRRVALRSRASTRSHYLHRSPSEPASCSRPGFAAGRLAEQLRRARDRYREISESDSLTRLANADTFRRHYSRSVEHSARSGEPLSLLILDVDQLKGVNDELGHSFGSAALRHVGGVLEELKRAGDLAARWGGDEFTLLMPGAEADTAWRRAESVLERLRAQPVRVDGRERTISATMGSRPRAVRRRAISSRSRTARSTPESAPAEARCAASAPEAAPRLLQLAGSANSVGIAWASAPSIARSRSLVDTPPGAEKPPVRPFAARTRWQGIRMGIGFAPSAAPTSRACDGSPRRLAISP